MIVNVWALIFTLVYYVYMHASGIHTLAASKWQIVAEMPAAEVEKDITQSSIWAFFTPQPARPVLSPHPQSVCKQLAPYT